MLTGTEIASATWWDITSEVRDVTHATIDAMPRRARPATDSKATRALDAVVSEYDEVEARLKEIDVRLKAAVVEAAKEAAQPDNPLTITEIAARVGWTREYVSRLASEAGVKQRETPKRAPVMRPSKRTSTRKPRSAD